MKNLLLLMAFLLLAPAAISAQNNKNFSEEFNFDKESTEEVIEINVKPNTKSLTIEVNGHITDGSLYVKSINPNGKKSGNMSLLTSGYHKKHKIKMKDHGHDDGTYEVEIEEIHGGEGDDDYEIITEEIQGGEDGEKDVRVIVKNSGNNNVSVTKKSKGKTKSKSNSSTNVNISSGKNNGAKGNMVEKHSDPEAGTWKFVIKTEGATGNLSVKIKQD